MKNSQPFHHELSGGEPEELRPGSDRGFGLVFAAVFGLLGLLPLINGNRPHEWLIAASVIFGGTALLMPWLLRPLNYVWFRFGLLLHAVVNPTVMALVYILAVVPIGALLKVLRKDPLSLEIRDDADSYWIPRERARNGPSSMRDQF